MSRPRSSLLSRTAAAVVVLVALALPAMLAVNLVRAAGAPASRLPSGLLGGPMLLAQADTGGTQPTPASGRLVTGVLYTRGRAEVEWNGARFEVQGGSYAYVGGETVRMAPDAIGLLKLPGGGQVFFCGGSEVRFTGNPGDGYRLDVVTGSGRVQVPAGTDFTIAANDTQVRPAAPPPPGAAVVETEVVAAADGGCLVCELTSAVRVTVAGTPEPQPEAVGRVVEVAAAGAAGVRPVSSQPIPPALLRAAASGGNDAPGYLCRCEALKHALEAEPDEERRLADAQTGDDAATETAPADAEADAAPAAAVLAEAGPAAPDPAAEAGPAAPDPAAGDGPPPVAPPDVPPAAIADAAAPDPFDPNVLPPPAAGEPSDPVVVVAPPGVPGFGAGGGGGGGGGDVASGS